LLRHVSCLCDLLRHVFLSLRFFARHVATKSWDFAEVAPLARIATAQTNDNSSGCLM
jgi:hypothetical protein